MAKKLTGAFFWPLVILAFILQIVISITTYHPDLRAFVLASKFIGQGEVLTFYDHVSYLPQGDLVKKIYGDDIFIYPPLAYLIPSAFYIPFSGILHQAGETIILSDGSLRGLSTYPTLFLYKLPFLIFGLLTFIFLPKLFSSKEKGRLAQLLWIYAPVTIFVGAGVGQADTILTFFLLMSLIFLKKNSYGWASVFVALSALIKPLGLALLPLIAVKGFRDGGLKKMFFSVAPGILTWLIFIVPYLQSPAFKMYAFLASLAGKSTFAGITISSGTSIPWLYVIYTLIILLLYSDKLSLIDSFGLTILSTLVFNHFHPQWFLWFVPWLLYYTVNNHKYYLRFAVLACWVIIWLSFDFSQSLGMFLSLKNIFTPLTFNPLQNSSIVLLARAGLVSSLFFLIYECTQKEQ